ncbi:MAG TPA: ATP-dependent 6-phosphofructokinase [Chthoniobacterales bacterium]|nr:ATP-dependent 6-phosphofructokinase [Chthoniobacterales bacterium]
MNFDLGGGMEAVIESLGEGRYLSPLRHRVIGKNDFRTDEHRVIYDDSMEGVRDMFERGLSPLNFEMAGPREKIYFDPAKTSAAIVTCGGLCPGLNDIIRGVVMELYHRYGVTRIFGLKYGYEGLVPRLGHVPLALRPESVSTIHTFGGTILGSSRGPQDPGEMVEHLEELGVDILFIVGGDGTLRGGVKLANEIRRRGLRKSVIGIPKTIDNDIAYLDKSFGFDTAFGEAVKAVACAHVEAMGARNGIGLVKLMGRHSGFISCYAALAGQHVNYCLIPEVPFRLDGPSGLLEALRYRLAHRKHAVIVAAEGAGQDLMNIDASTTDASGNTRLGNIGEFLKDRITEFFKQRRIEVNVKYIDPSYTIRSVPAAAQDNAYCLRLAQNAVHAGMAGKTRMLIGQWHSTLVHIPFELVTQGRQKVDPGGSLWQAVLECTGQPVRII